MNAKSSRCVELAPDRSFDGVSRYRWVNIIDGNNRIGKARSYQRDNELVIYSIQVFPAYRKQGYGRAVVERCKELYSVIIADRVRNTARAFWASVGFTDTLDGNYVWRKQ